MSHEQQSMDFGESKFTKIKASVRLPKWSRKYIRTTVLQNITANCNLGNSKLHIDQITS